MPSDPQRRLRMAAVVVAAVATAAICGAIARRPPPPEPAPAPAPPAEAPAPPPEAPWVEEVLPPPPAVASAAPAPAAPPAPPGPTPGALDPRALELFEWGRGHYLNGSYPHARACFDEALRRRLDRERTERAHLFLAYMAYFHADDVAAAELIARVPTGTAGYAGLKACFEGPFRRKYGSVARAGEGKTPRYYLATDVDFDPERPSNEAFLALGARLEAIRTEFLAFLGTRWAQAAGALVPRVFVFRRRRDYIEFAVRMRDGAPSRPAFYSPQLRTIVIDASASGDLERSLRHEAFHEIIDASVGFVPSWLDEGFAEYFGEGSMHDDDLMGRAAPDQATRRYRLTELVRSFDPALPVERRFTPLEQLVALEPDDFQRRPWQHYPQAWSFVHFLQHGFSEGPRMVRRYLDDLDLGGEPATAARAAFGNVDWPALEDEWKKYVRKLLAQEDAAPRR